MDASSYFWWITLTILSAIPLIYWYLTRSYNYWTRIGINGPKPWIFGGNNFHLFVTPMPILEVEWHKKYGKLYGVYDRDRPTLTVAEPHLIKRILVKDFYLFTDRKTLPITHPIISRSLFSSKGEDWRRLRSIISPTFTSGKMKKMYPMVRQCLDEFLNHLDIYAKERKDINLKDMHGNYTMDVIATCAFATKTNAHKDPNNPFILYAKQIFHLPLLRMLLVFILPKPVLSLLNIKSLMNEKANDFFLNLTQHIVNKRRTNGKNNYNDFIQLLVNADKDTDEIHDESDKDEAHHVNQGVEELEIEKKILSVNEGNKRLTEEEIQAQGWIFFIAGYETTATTLTFCSYELALHPEIQDRIYEEIQTAVDSNGEISYEKLAKLSFLDSVLSETLRLYSPVQRLQRKSLSDYKLGDTGITLYKGQDIEIPVYAIHHSEEYYANASQFNPDRFMPDNRHKIIPYTYLPFGAGPRNCIGMRFALMEAKLGLAQIIRRFKFFRSEQTAVPLEFKKASRMTSAKSVIVGIEKRY